MKKLIFLIIAITFLPAFSEQAIAFVRSSPNYYMESDSLNSGGSDLSSSTNYKLKDTIGEAGSGISSSTNYINNAGYRQMESSYLALSVINSLTLSPDISGVSGGTADALGIWTVMTDAASGYNLSVRTNTNPSLKSGSYTVADYTANTSTIPDFDWNVSSVASEFGYSPYNSSNLVQKFKNNGVNCNIGSSATDGKCWLNASTTDTMIVRSTSRTNISGDDTTIHFRATVGDSYTQLPGVYTATVYLTAVVN